MTTIKITELTNIGANLASTTVFPVVNMSGTPTTEKTVLGNIANVILSGAGGNYVAVGAATVAATVTTNAQPNITSTGSLTGLTVSNASGTVNFSNTANVTLGAVGNLHIAGGTAGQLLSTNGNGTLSWASDTTTYGNSNVVSLLSAFGANTITTTGNITGGNINIPNGYANVTGTANIVGGGATVATKSVLNVASTFGSNDANDPASAQAVRGRVTGANLTKTRNYVTGVTGQYLVTGTNASEFIKAGVLGVVGDQTTTADGAVVAYLDGDGGLTTANAAYAVSMKNSTPNSGFNYGLDLQFINLNVAGTTTTFKQADIRFNNGVTLVANTANNISINANVTAGNVLTGGQVIANGVIDSGAGLTTGGYLSVDGNTDLHNTVVTGNLSATGNITANNLGNISAINLTGSNSNVLYGNGVFAPAAGGGANTGNVTFNNQIILGTGSNDGSGGLYLAPGTDSIANSAVQYLRVRGGDNLTHIHLDTGNNQFYDQYFGDDTKYVKLELGEAGNVVVGTDDDNGNLYSWSFTSDGNLILADGNSVIQSIANSSLDTLNPNVSTMVLTPDANYNSQVLVLDPTASGHIHLRAYAFSNIDEPAANIFLGGEDTAFEITSGANNQAVIHSNGKAWTFGDDGNISSDTLTFTTTFANVKTVEYQTAGVWDLYVEDSITGSNTAISRLNVSFKDNLIDKPQVYIENTKESDGIALRWTFDENGNLTVPGSIINDTSIVLSAPAIFNICTIATAGSGYNTGSSLKATTGGSGTGMTVGIGYGLSNQLTSVSVVNPGTGYVNGDVITVSEGTGGTFVISKYNQSANQTNNNTIQTDFTFANSTVTLPIYGEMATDASMTLTTNLANAGNTSSWIFGDDGSLTLPIGVSIDYNGNVQYPTIMADSGKLFSVQGQGNTGSAALAWTVDPNAASQYAAVAVNRAGGDNLAKVVLQAQSDSGNVATVKLWKFDETGNLTLPGNTFAVNYANGTQVSLGSNSVAEASFSIQTANFNANVGGRYGVDTTSGAVTSTLPASPSTGGAIFFADAGGAFASNNLTINPNGQTIMGSSGNMTVSNNNQSFGLFFNGATWRTYN